MVIQCHCQHYRDFITSHVRASLQTSSLGGLEVWPGVEANLGAGGVEEEVAVISVVVHAGMGQVRRLRILSLSGSGLLQGLCSPWQYSEGHT